MDPRKADIDRSLLRRQARREFARRIAPTLLEAGFVRSKANHWQRIRSQVETVYLSAGGGRMMPRVLLQTASGETVEGFELNKLLVPEHRKAGSVAITLPEYQMRNLWLFEAWRDILVRQVLPWLDACREAGTVVSVPPPHDPSC